MRDDIHDTGAFHRAPPAAGRIRRVFALGALAAAAGVSMPACGGGDSPPAAQGATLSSGAGGPGSPCEDGAARACHIVLGEHDGVITCRDGVETCSNGAFGPCEGPTRAIAAPPAGEPAPAAPGAPTPLSLSAPAPCLDNPCDPSCQVFVEDPGAAGVTIPPVAPPYPWTVGDVNALPASLLAEGTHEPCSTAEDCQLDQRCDNPSGVACAHHPCATGAGLHATCSPCVQKICDAHPGCCNTEYPGPCLHDPCVQGSALKASCDPCVATICAARPGCCAPLCTSNADCAALVGPASTCDAQGRCTCGAGVGACPAGASCSSGRCTPFWGSASCAGQIPALCPGKTCPAPNTWTPACVAEVAATCGARCDAPPAGCPHDRCYTGDALPLASCGADPCITQICTAPGGDPTCCTSRWTQQCVDRVETLCGEACPHKGLCTSWLPGEADPSCAGVDLTLGVPCDGSIPLCNRGAAPVPAGTTLDIVSYPAGAGELPSSEPSEVLSSCDPAPGAPACSVTLPSPLSGGSCVSVTGCDGLSDGMELLVNPAGPNHIGECHCENNWTLHDSGPCQSPACIASASVSSVKKVTMFVSVDASTSMACSLNGCPAVCSDRLATRWAPMTAALTSFFADPASAGLGVALKLWPDTTVAGFCNDTPACPGPGGGGCAVPTVGLGTLAAAAGAADPHEQALIDAIQSRSPCRDTPMYPALDGATSWAVAHRAANPEEEVAVVLITDGVPSGCNTDVHAIAALASSAFHDHGVRTYAIGFGGSNPTFINQVASLGGGAAFNLTEGAGLQQALLDAMAAIRGDALPCDVEVPLAGASDPASVSVVVTSGAGVETTLAPLPDPASCGDGWYLDPLDPSIARLCPATCAAIQADPGAMVRAVVPCESSYSPLQYAQAYEADCPAGTKVQWGHLTYDSITPGDSSVLFQVRTADTAAGLSSAPLEDAAAARAAPVDTQDCGSGPPVCAVDLYDALGGLPAARKDHLELVMTLDPSSDGQLAPAVDAWGISYSCPASE